MAPTRRRRRIRSVKLLSKTESWPTGNLDLPCCFLIIWRYKFGSQTVMSDRILMMITWWWKWDFSQTECKVSKKLGLRCDSDFLLHRYIYIYRLLLKCIFLSHHDNHDLLRRVKARERAAQRYTVCPNSGSSCKSLKDDVVMYKMVSMFHWCGRPRHETIIM